MEDSKKIKDILKYLNDIHAPGKGSWAEAEGFHALVAAEVKNNIISAVPSSAVPLKIFVNTETGEVKTYLAKSLDDNFSAVPSAPTSTHAQAPSKEGAEV